MQDQLPCDSARKSARQIAAIRPVKESTDLHVIGHLSLLHKTVSILASIRNNQRTTWICANWIHFQLSFTSVNVRLRFVLAASTLTVSLKTTHIALLRSKDLNIRWTKDLMKDSKCLQCYQIQSRSNLVWINLDSDIFDVELQIMYCYEEIEEMLTLGSKKTTTHSLITLLTLILHLIFS